VEGPTENLDIDKLRTRQVKNFFTVTMLSVGMPMMLMGDEVRRTQGGNNNAYCQDNETRLVRLDAAAKRADMHRFVTLLNACRVLRDVEPERQRVALNQLIRQADITWHGVRLHEPDGATVSHSVAFTARLTTERVLFHVILNAYWEPLEFELSSVANGDRHPWRRWIDTFLDSPHDIVEWERAPSVPAHSYRAEPRSVVVLFAGHDPAPLRVRSRAVRPRLAEASPASRELSAAGAAEEALHHDLSSQGAVTRKPSTGRLFLRKRLAIFITGATISVGAPSKWRHIAVAGVYPPEARGRSHGNASHRAGRSWRAAHSIRGDRDSISI